MKKSNIALLVTSGLLGVGMVAAGRACISTVASSDCITIPYDITIPIDPSEDIAFNEASNEASTEDFYDWALENSTEADAEWDANTIDWSAAESTDFGSDESILEEILPEENVEPHSYSFVGAAEDATSDVVIESATGADEITTEATFESTDHAVGVNEEIYPGKYTVSANDGCGIMIIYSRDDNDNETGTVYIVDKKSKISEIDRDMYDLMFSGSIDGISKEEYSDGTVIDLKEGDTLYIATVDGEDVSIDNTLNINLHQKGENV